MKLIITVQHYRHGGISNKGLPLTGFNLYPFKITKVGPSVLKINLTLQACVLKMQRQLFGVLSSSLTSIQTVPTVQNDESFIKRGDEPVIVWVIFNKIVERLRPSTV